MEEPDKSKMKTDCPEKQQCMKLLQRIMDGEASDSERQHFIDHHLSECLPCYQSYHLEVAIKDMLKSKCTGSAPNDLVEKIKNAIRQNNII